MRGLPYIRSIAVLVLAATFYSSFAPAEEVPSIDTPSISIHLASESNSFYAGYPQWVAIQFDLPESWHAYWKNPGSFGYPISVDWTLPSGFSVSELKWPSPEREVSDVGVLYQYSGKFWLLAKMTPEKNLLEKQATVSAEIHALVCSGEHCIPIEKTVSLTLPVKEGPPSVDSDFSHARDCIPQERNDIQVNSGAGFFEIVVPGIDEAKKVYFYPEEEGVVQSTELPLFVNDLGMTHVLLAQNEGGDFPSSLQGSLVIEHPNGFTPLLISSPVTSGLSEIAQAFLISSPPNADFQGKLLMALAFAFLGGLLLNLMPCVLPVVSLKIFSFVKMSGQKRSQTLLLGAAFSLGVLFSFWILAVLLLLLQAYGHAVGWGFQLQEPIFVASLAVVMLIFSLSLFGVFELGTGVAAVAGQAEVKTKGNRYSSLCSSFFSGVLATAVATPCTGPFLGSAVGWAVTLPPQYAMVIFTSLGLGMAFPYLLISAFPQMVRFLPKPGAWMNTFKEILGFVMLATVLWLMWVFAAQTATISLFILMGGLLSFALGCWVYGKWGAPVRKKWVRMYAYASVLFFCLLGGYAVVVSSSLEPASPNDFLPESEIAMADPKNSQYTPWERYSEVRLAYLRSQGTPVLIDFTARWCLICQVNHASLSSSEVEKKIQAKGVVKMLADWTRHDPEITKALAKYGRNGVPLYLVYPKDGNEPHILPQVLTPDTVLQYLNKI